MENNGETKKKRVRKATKKQGREGAEKQRIRTRLWKRPIKQGGFVKRGAVRQGDVGRSKRKQREKDYTARRSKQGGIKGQKSTGEGEPHEGLVSVGLKKIHAAVKKEKRKLREPCQKSQEKRGTLMWRGKKGSLRGFSTRKASGGGPTLRGATRGKRSKKKKKPRPASGGGKGGDEERKHGGGLDSGRATQKKKSLGKVVPLRGPRGP